MKNIEVEDKNVVLVVADTLTALHLPTYGYDRDTAPFLTELAENNTYFENAYSNAPWTVPSHASLFSGELPSEHGTNSGNKVFQSQSFVETLQENSYRTLGVSANQLVCEELNFDRGFDSFHEVFNFDSSDSAVLWKAALQKIRNFDLESLKEGLIFLYNKSKGEESYGAENIERTVKDADFAEENPNFVFLNYTEPHLPYNSPIEFASQFTENAEEKISRNMNDHYETDKPEIYYQGFPNCTDKELVDLYDGAIKYLDHKLEQLYSYLNEELDDLVFIVTSDHGENFGEHGAYFHQCGIWEKSIRVPMIIAGEGVPEQKIEENYSLRNLKHLLLENQIKTSKRVYAEYNGTSGFNNSFEKKASNLTRKERFGLNKSKAIVSGKKAMVRNSAISDFQFITDQRCCSQEGECFDQEPLQEKLNLILGTEF
jgi:arylsulfatase A-like enzyme